MTITLSNIDAQRAFGGKLIVALTWLMAAVVIAARLAIHGSIGGVLVACIGIATAALVAWRTAGNGSTGRALTGVALMAQVSMLVAAMGGHAWQIDMHMAYFAALALLVIYCDWLVIAAAAATVAVHHLGLSFLLPMAVFPNDANLGRVIVHAAILIVEAVTLIGVTMSVNAMFEAADSARRKAEDAMSAALSAQLLNTDYTAQIEAIGRSQAIIEFSTDGIVLNANDNFLRTMGYTLAEVKGNHHSLFVDPADATDPAYKQFWESLGRGEFKTGEFKRITKDGGEVWIQGSYNPIAGDNGEVLKVVKFATDVTARVRSVLEIGGALTRLAEGDLEHRLQKPLPPELDELRTDLNRAIEALQDAMLSVGHSAQSVKRGADEIRNSSESLSRRTETQASGLEKTAAALGEITANVKKTADGARQARDAVSAAKNDADRSGAIVSEAVEAMGGIESSSNQISQIIGVIDEIAFQTNLLALNAGVEAARAGDSGRGFAVVAQEVRALAQRSANAAKEIKSLISTSSQQVATGVKLVGEAGRALQRIAAQVSDINSVITEIAASANEQAIGLNQVNTTINQMDQVTKQNAAMVEETTAACHGLSDEANELTCLISRFDVGDEANVQASGRQAPQKAATQRLAASRPALKII